MKPCYHIYLKIRYLCQYYQIGALTHNHIILP